MIAERGSPADSVFLIAHGRVEKIGSGPYGSEAMLGVLTDGDHFGEPGLTEAEDQWQFTARAATACTVLVLPRAALQQIADLSPELITHMANYRARPALNQNKYGEQEVALSAGHHGEEAVPGSYVGYDPSPREYELSIAQTVLRMHSRVADLYNDPMDQTEQQLRLTVEALRERQEHELVNNRSFGLLHNVDYGQRFRSRTGPPTPDDLDDLLSRRSNSKLFLAHPAAVAAFGRECNKRGLTPGMVDIHGHQIPAWRGVPIFPCNKLPVAENRTSSILVMRTGEKEQGVVGLHQTGIPDEYDPSLSVRFMGINEQAIISYLVTAYFSAAVLVPDALGMLENVQVSQWD